MQNEFLDQHREALRAAEEAVAAEPDEDLELDDAEAVKVRLRHYGPDKFLLSSRGFHWINEVPYNQYGSRNEPPPKIMPPPKRP